ncbi:MAG: tetratricopeptide repeat protein [Candidatus Methylacidiphilales bacterium]|nr:tetratricopeptide repeat protein [Candidatus Methylacidiphilales bacterium]
MTRMLFVLGLVFALVLGPQARAASSPQDLYLRIYLLIQEAEKLEIAGQKASARERYSIALDRLDSLQKSNPDWESTIVKYRQKYCKDKIDTLKEATDANPDQIIPPVPSDLVQGQMAPAPSAPPRDLSPNEKLNVSAAPMIETTNNGGAPATGADEPSTLKSRIRDLESQLSETKERLEEARAEAAQLRSKVNELDNKIRIALEGSTDEKVAMLMKENQQMRAKLGSTEGAIASMQTSPGGASLVNLQEQVKKIQDQLALSRSENEALQKTNEEYRNKLNEVQKQLAEAEVKTAAATESLRKEVGLLRGIVDRQMKEQARREVAKRMALEELAALNIESSKLKTQLDILGSPLVELTEEEKGLLRQPTASVAADTAGGNFSAPLSETGADYANRPRVPGEFKDLAREANELFAQGKFDEAAAKYQTILNTYPDSLYALSNIAVVRFQQQNYKEAEIYLRKAVQQSPQDAFSHSILGISLYQQGKYDEAVQMLSRAIALDPNDPKTRNYLGISASQKGWQEAAEQECRKAIELDPNYGDAHFNLAVIYATQKPPSLELARRHYNRAVELGIPRDQQLEGMIK